ncbi:alpha/beta hydrolase fold domain-containing protein [Pokkaliibacter sp. CJK22405]|uniref:alpha/beta hydrolase family protein n=1 Tax=Pokkaliibacter sp. CJK22405 TaxID=3384615 RepID=UPI00398522A8
MRLVRSVLLLLTLAGSAQVVAAPERLTADTSAMLESSEGWKGKDSLGAQRSFDLSYGFTAKEKLDIYLPAHPPKAIIVIVHGGAWRTGDKSAKAVIANKGQHFIDQGYAFMSINYPLLPDANPDVQAQAVAMAISKIQIPNANTQMAVKNIIVIGHSAGAHLLALISANPRAYPGLQPWRASILLDSAALDVPKIMRARHFPLYDKAFGKEEAFWEKVSPVHHIKQPVPSLFVCSSRRRTACEQASEASMAWQAQGGSSAVLPEDLSHRQINDELGQPSDYTSAVDAFIEQHLAL